MLVLEENNAIKKGRSTDEKENYGNGDDGSNGIRFYIGNDKVWLSDPIPPEYIRILE